MEVLSDEHLFHFWRLGDNNGKDYTNRNYQDMFSYAITPYTCYEEYAKDMELMRIYNSSNNPQVNFLLTMAAKSKRTDDQLMKQWGAKVYKARK